MLVSDVVVRVQRTFGDEASVQVTEEDIIRWVNDGQREIIMKTEDLLQSQGVTSTVNGQQDYTVPENMLILRSIHYKPIGLSSFIRLQSLSMAEFDDYIDGWDGTSYSTSEPVVYCTYGGFIKFFPIPMIDGSDNLKIRYSRRPADVTLTSDTIDLPDEYFNSLVSYVLSQAFQLDEDWGSSQNLAAQFEQDVRRNQQRHNSISWETYPTIGVRPEDAW